MVRELLSQIYSQAVEELPEDTVENVAPEVQKHIDEPELVTKIDPTEV